MLAKKTALLIGTGIIFTLGVTVSAFAATCPTDLQRNHNGFWFSDTKPGWKSHRATKNGITVSSDNFGGVVYSPKRNRMACVYKASNGKWVALVSNMHQGINIDKAAADDKGKGPAWRYSSKHKDYACGRPTVTRISGCSFQLED